MKLAITLTFMSIIFVSSPLIRCSDAANIYIGADELYGAPVVMIDGEIVPGDLDNLKEISAELILDKEFRYFRVYLNSNGGDVIESMKIGNFLREMLAKTFAVGFLYYDPNTQYGKEALGFLDKNPDEKFMFNKTIFKPYGEKLEQDQIKRCYSSCILIFYGGVERDTSDNGYFRDESNKIPVIGLHRPYFEQGLFSGLSPSEARVAYKQLEAETKKYLLNMGAPTDLVERMFRTASNDVELLSHEEFKKYYQRKEPYFDEWLLAKCGNPGAENVLSSAELADWEVISEQEMAERKRTGLDPLVYLQKYGHHVPDNLTKDYVELLWSKVSKYNHTVSDCRIFAVKNYQINWAEQYYAKKIENGFK